MTTTDPHKAMVAFVKLAAISHDREQFPSRDKFLLLAALEADRAAESDIAERCRDLVVTHNPQHLVRQYSNFAAAMMDPDFQLFAKQLQRFCSYERAEMYLSQQDLAAGVPGTGKMDPGDYASLLLSRFA